jgi:Ser-tRNA(Ala) deacylase AlaX
VTERVFWDDPYLTTLDARVVAVAGSDVTLDRTILFAFSGGQESDRGTIGGFPVLEARKLGDDILYTLPEGHGLRPGYSVVLQLDWPRRYRLMRLHFAAELVLELVTQALPGVAKIGAHIAEDKARIDFEWPQSVMALLPQITAQAIAIIDADRPIVSAFSNPARGLRYWEVEGLARVPCGGTHLRTTGEVGALALKRRNVGKGKERIEILLVEPAK